MVRFAWALSMSVGFLSLSQEILWVRLVSFILKGLSQAFPLVLFCFLVGIACGSWIGKRFCERHSNLLYTSAVVLASASILDLSLVFLIPVLVKWRAGLAAVLLLVTLTAALKSVLFPIAHHIGSQQSGAAIGRSISKVYFGNILGSTLGPVITGYVLLDHMTLEQCLFFVGLATGVLSLLCAARVGALILGFSTVAALVFAIFVASYESTSAVAAIAEATMRGYPKGSKIEHVVQNRNGIIHTVSTPNGSPDTIMGGNEYDGLINVAMDANYNALDRALVLLGVHPKPDRVLAIGLSTGAWVRILSSSPRIKEITVVEINPGYLNVIAQYPQVAGILSDPRVRIIIDDGRRWLRRNKTEAFDLIIQNTTFSWRAYSTNLLSREYMLLVQSHLRPGGISAINSTFSSDVLKTARDVFPFVERRASFIYAGGSDFSQATVGAEEAFRELRLNGSAVFAEAAFGANGVASDMITTPFVAHAVQYDGLSPFPGITTDQNLLVEQAHGKLREIIPGFYRAVDKARARMGK